VEQEALAEESPFLVDALQGPPTEQASYRRSKLTLLTIFQRPAEPEAAAAAAASLGKPPPALVTLRLVALAESALPRAAVPQAAASLGLEALSESKTLLHLLHLQAVEAVGVLGPEARAESA
jgi:hypothetical protein